MPGYKVEVKITNIDELDALLCKLQTQRKELDDTLSQIGAWKPKVRLEPKPETCDLSTD